MNHTNQSDSNSPIEAQREQLYVEIAQLEKVIQEIETLDEMEAFQIPFIEFIEHYKAFAAEHSKIDIDINIEAYQNRFLEMITYIKEEKHDATVEWLKDRILNTDLFDAKAIIKEVGLSFDRLYDNFVDEFLRETLSKAPQCEN